MSEFEFTDKQQELAAPNGRYKNWMMICYQSSNNKIAEKQSLEVLEIAYDRMFEKYKMFEYVIYEDLKNSFPLYITVGRILKRTRESTLKNLFIESVAIVSQTYNNMGQFTFMPFKLTVSYEYWDIDYCSIVNKSCGMVNLVSSKETSSEYKGKDIRLLDERDNRYPWQNSILDLFYDEKNKEFKDADNRIIYWIQDKKGATGKSKFVKWVFVNHPEDIGKMVYGNGGQLRSSIISGGVKKVYFIDLPRTPGTEDSLDTLLSVIEELKNGLIVSNRYGKSRQIVMDPPHVIIFTNMDFPRKKLSSDRWKVFQIYSVSLKLKKI